MYENGQLVCLNKVTDFKVKLIYFYEDQQDMQYFWSGPDQCMVNGQWPDPSLVCVCVCMCVCLCACVRERQYGFLPGAGAAASWRAEPPAAPTSEAAGASGWPGYSSTVPAPEDRQKEKEFTYKLRS